ncbi:related to Sorting nexin 9 [Ustilago trichophora]|uniref:Related to Sorting nexin 9 n=1 Tax=Ustilago trichophora TaxID=86804 RepID=A0A5C3E8M2_9BASI|nr:related to Sorting nexin 9 [Ustilago trichophora]
MTNDVSPTGSVRSIASSRSGTLSRPPPPPKPSHLSSAFTGTCNSIALRHYIQTHTTGGSFTTHSPSTATISRAHLGHGYDSSTVDHFVDAFDTSSEDEDEHNHSTSRPSVRGRTYTAPSVSRVFDLSSHDQDAGDGTTRLVRNQPIAINGSGPSRVGNLRSMFEAAVPTTSTSVALSRQNTGIAFQHTGTKSKPRISNQVRMLQAQITGDRFNGLAGALNVADARSSVIIEKRSERSDHQREATDLSQASSIYRTATQDLFGDALKMDAVVMPPISNTDTLKASPSSSFPSASSAFASHLTQEPSTIDTDATISRSTSAKNGLTSSRILNIAAQHDRDDSSATIRPSHSNQDITATPASRNGTISSPDAIAGTARRRSTRLASSSKKGRLSSIFTASPQSSDCSGSVDQNGAGGISPSPSGVSIANCSASEAQSEAERSREPSMLIADDDDVSFSRTSHHLCADDGSRFDLDWGSNASPAKATSVRRIMLETLTDSSTEDQAASSTLDEVEEATIDANPRRNPRLSAEVVTMKAGPSPIRPPSIVLNLNSSEDSTDTPAPAPSSEDTPLPASGSTLAPTTASVLHAPRPISARMPQPGIGKPARALYDFEGEAAFNELIIRAGQPFDIIKEQLAGGWSLGVVWDEDGVPTRGLIPQGWYCYIQDFTRSPPASHGIEPPPTPDLVGQDAEADNVSLPPAAVSSDRSPTSQGSRLGSKAESPIHRIGSVGRSQSRVLPAEYKQIKEEQMLSQSTNGSVHRVSTSTPPSEVQAAVEPQTPPISVSAFLHIGNKAAQWQEVETADSKTQQIDTQSHTDSIVVDNHEMQDDDHATVFANSGNAIDGMPAVSTEANPIDWSAVAASQPQAEATQTETMQMTNGTVEQAYDNATPAPETVSTATTGSDWTGSIFGKKTFNRFASFVTSGAEDYVLSNSDIAEDERSRSIARKVSGGKPSVPLALTEVVEEDEGAFGGDGAVHSSKASVYNDATRAVEGCTTEAEVSVEDPNRHFVIAGPAGPKWKSKCPPFLVQVHHPEKRTKLNGMQEYTVYHVTSTYPLKKAAEDAEDGDLAGSHGCIPYDPLGGPYPPGAQVTVLRRFTQFEWLHQVLSKHYSALLIPPPPEKQYSGRFASDFIETRRADLEMWISRLVRHPVLRYSEPMQFFLSCEDEATWRTNAAALLRYGEISPIGKAAKGGVFAQTWHPDFNFDSTEAAEEADRMELFLKALEKTINGVGGHNAGKNGVLAAFKGHREGNVATSSTYRDLSYTLLRTLTGAGAGPSDGKEANAVFTDDDAHRIHGPPMGNVGRRSETGATNEHGAWCWREDCQDCLNLTSALQNTAECLQNVADIYESHARETLLRQHERFKEVSRPHTMAQALLETHRTTLSRYREATGEVVDPWADGVSEDDKVENYPNSKGAEVGAAMKPGEEAEKVASRCETVLNVTLSEMDRLHDERVQDYHALGRSLLDGEIELYESILEQLKTARLHYDEEYYDREPDFHILASRYQPELARPKKPSAPLLMPSAAQGGLGGLRSAAAGGVGLLISQATGGGGVTRPASIGIEGGSVGCDRSALASPRGPDVSLGEGERSSEGGGKGGFMSSFLTPSTIKHRPSNGRLMDSTNVLANASAADAALRAVSIKHGGSLDQRSSSYFSAIWR